MKLTDLFLYLFLGSVVVSCNSEDDTVQPVEVTVVNPQDAVVEKDGFRIDKLSIEYTGADWTDVGIRGRIVNVNNTLQYSFYEYINSSATFPVVATQFGLLDDSEWRIYTYSNNDIDESPTFITVVDPSDFVIDDENFTVTVERTSPPAERIKYTLSGKMVKF